MSPNQTSGNTMEVLQFVLEMVQNRMILIDEADKAGDAPLPKSREEAHVQGYHLGLKAVARDVEIAIKAIEVFREEDNAYQEAEESEGDSEMTDTDYIDELIYVLIERTSADEITWHKSESYGVKFEHSDSRGRLEILDSGAFTIVNKSYRDEETVVDGYNQYPVAGLIEAVEGNWNRRVNAVLDRWIADLQSVKAQASHVEQMQFVRGSEKYLAQYREPGLFNKWLDLDPAPRSFDVCVSTIKDQLAKDAEAYSTHWEYRISVIKKK